MIEDWLVFVVSIVVARSVEKFGEAAVGKEDDIGDGDDLGSKVLWYHDTNSNSSPRHGYRSPLEIMQTNAISHCDETEESEGAIGTILLLLRSRFLKKTLRSHSVFWVAQTKWTDN